MFSQLLYGNGGNTNHPHHSPTPQQQSQPAQPQQSHHATADGTHLFALDNSHPHHQLLSQALSLQEQQQHVMNLMLQSYALSGHHLPHPHAHHSPHHPHAHHPHSHHSSSPHSNDGSPVNNSTSPSSSSQPFLPSLVHTLPEHKTSTAVDTTSAATSPSNNSSNNSSHNSNSSSILVLSDEDVEFLSQSHAPDYVNDRSHPSTAAASAATTTSMDGIVSQCVPQQYHQATNHQRSPHSQPLTNSNEPFNSATPGIIHEQFNFDTVPNNFLSVIQEKQRILQKREEMQEEHQAAQKQRDSRKSSSSSSSGSERMASPESSSQSSYGGDSPQRSNTPLQESSPKAPANRKRSRAQVESDQVELEKLLTVPEKERTEQQKKTILKLRNRQTAKRSRDRKKLEFEATIEENKKLVQSNKQLADQVKKLKNENEELKRTVDLLTKGHHGAMAAAALHHHHHHQQQQQQQQRPAYLTPQGNMVDSPDSFVTLTVADDNVPHQEDDIEQMMNGEFDYLNHTDPMGQPKGFQAFSPLFTFQNESTNHPNKKSKMFMLVFFVACICCFFIGTTLVNELPSHAILMNANKSSPKRHKEVRLLNTHLYKHTYIPQNPSTSFDDAIKNIITQHQDLQQSSSALPATNVASTTTVKTLSESASSNAKQAPVAIEVVEEVVEELVEEIVEVKDDEEVDIKDQLEISNKNNKNNMMSNVDVHVNPDLNQWLQEQLKVSSSDSVPVMVKFDINDKTSAFILTSMDKNFTEEQQKLFVSQYKTSLISDMRGVCPRPLKVIQ